MKVLEMRAAWRGTKTARWGLTSCHRAERTGLLGECRPIRELIMICNVGAGAGTEARPYKLSTGMAFQAHRSDQHPQPLPLEVLSTIRIVSDTPGDVVSMNVAVPVNCPRLKLACTLQFDDEPVKVTTESPVLTEPLPVMVYPLLHSINRYCPVIELNWKILPGLVSLRKLL